MRCLQKIGQCGNSAHLTLPRAVLFYLGWLPGELIILELTETKELVVRRPNPDEFAPKRVKLVMLDRTAPVTT